MSYIDGFVIAVPTANKEKYKTHAEASGAIFKEYGALKLMECWGDDVPDGVVTSFPMAVKCEPHETVCFSWIVWPSRMVRDENWAKVMEDPRMKSGGELDMSQIFDGKRMIYGGFEVIVDV